MLEKLGIGEKPKGRKDLRSKKVIFVDDGSNPYRTMCFTIAAKLAKRRGAEVETTVPGAGEVPHAKVVEVTVQPKPKVQRPDKPAVRREPNECPVPFVTYVVNASRAMPRRGLRTHPTSQLAYETMH